MNIVNIATLKERLSHYLSLVRGGEEVIVTSHKQAVARILPVAAPDADPRKPLRPVSDLRRVKGIKTAKSVSAVEWLLEERRGR